MGRKSKWTVVSEVPASEPDPGQNGQAPAAESDVVDQMKVIEEQTKKALADLEQVRLAEAKKGYITDLEHHQKYGKGVQTYDQLLSQQGKALRDQIAKAKRELELAKMGKGTTYKVFVPAGEPPKHVRDIVAIFTSEEVTRLIRALETQERMLTIGRQSKTTPISVKQDGDVADGTLIEYLRACTEASDVEATSEEE